MTVSIIISNVVFHKCCTTKLSKKLPKRRKESNSRWTICLGFGRYICNCRFTPRQTMSVYANVINLKMLTFFTWKHESGFYHADCVWRGILGWSGGEYVLMDWTWQPHTKPEPAQTCPRKTTRWRLEAERTWPLRGRKQKNTWALLGNYVAFTS